MAPSCTCHLRLGSVRLAYQVNEFEGEPIDIWSLAVTFYYLYYREYPFYDTDPVKLQRLIETTEYQWLTQTEIPGADLGRLQRPLEEEFVERPQETHHAGRGLRASVHHEERNEAAFPHTGGHHHCDRGRN